jgi:hypothetical protein
VHIDRIASAWLIRRLIDSVSTCCSSQTASLRASTARRPRCCGIAGTHWGITLNDDHFTVSLDQKVLFTAFEHTRMKDGHIALWTQEDSIARFDRIEVRALPPTEWR